MPGLLQRFFDAKWLIFGVALVLLLLWIMRPFLDVIVYAIFVYYITRPIEQWVSRRVHNKSLAVTISLLLLALPLILLITYTLLFGLSQLMGVVHDYGLTSAIPAGPLANLTQTFSLLQPNATSGSLSLANITSQGWYKQISGYSGLLPTVQAIVFAMGGTIADILFKFFLIFFIAFTMLNEDQRIFTWFSGAFPRLVEERKRLFVRYLQGVDTDLEKIFFSNLISIVFFALIAVLAFLLVNMVAPPSLQVPEPILLGILCGVCALVPLIGMWLVLGPLLLYMIAAGLLTGTLVPNLPLFVGMWIFIFIFVTTLPGFVVGPVIARGHVKTGLLMFAYLIGPLVFGISGIFLGVIVLVLLVNYFSIVLPEVSGELTVGEVGD